jgi:ABC-type Fe3+-hydroxamate transport system substrate-binding protein
VNAARRRMLVASMESSATEQMCTIVATRLASDPATYSPANVVMSRLVGVSQFCDYPHYVSGLPKLTKSLVTGTTSEEVEEEIKELRGKGLVNLHSINSQLLATLKPSILFTQDSCDRCGVMDSLVGQSLSDAGMDTRSPMLIRSITVEDMLVSTSLIGDAIGEGDRARQLRESFQRRLDTVKAAVSCRRFLDLRGCKFIYFIHVQH